MQPSISNRYASLILGWQVTQSLDPSYWVNNPDAKPGFQLDTDLVEVPANTIGAHTAIIAQSGSGKSYFLGRLIEEVMLRTRARCVILDPNSDFRRIYEIENPSLWKAATYKLKERRGKLPHEISWEEFVSNWSNLSIRIRGGMNLVGDKCEQLHLWWPSLDVQFLADDVDPMYRSDLYHCHSFIKTLGRLLEIKLWATGKSTDLIDSAQRVFRQARVLEMVDLRDALEQEYTSFRLIGRNLDEGDGAPDDYITVGAKILVTRVGLQGQIKRFIEAALTVTKYVSPSIERFYFGKAREYLAGGILQSVPEVGPSAGSQSNRLEVVDFPSMPENIRPLAINALLATEWLEAKRAWDRALQKPPVNDQRVPVFIVIDEAHNLIPRKTRTKAESALREQFRTLAAEGRKYGLFLILVSQRPDKLDPLVLSECENKAVMKLGSTSVLNITKRMLGLDDLPSKTLERCLEFDTGRVLLAGRWAPNGPITLFSAARRTLEGGRNLREDYWAKAPDVLKVKPKARSAKGAAKTRNVLSGSSKKRQ